MGVHWKIQFLGGGARFTKVNLYGELSKKCDAWTVWRLKGGLPKRAGGLRGFDSIMHSRTY